MKYRLFPDELEAYKNREMSLIVEYKDAGVRCGEATSQSSETWHDNFEFEDASRAMELASKKLREVQDILAHSQIVHIVSDEGIVSMGKIVILLVDGKEVTYTVGGYQTPIEGRVSYNAPLIKAILGKEEGEVVHFDLNGKNVEVEILEISQGLTF